MQVYTRNDVDVDGSSVLENNNHQNWQNQPERYFDSPLFNNRRLYVCLSKYINFIVIHILAFLSFNAFLSFIGKTASISFICLSVFLEKI